MSAKIWGGRMIQVRPLTLTFENQQEGVEQDFLNAFFKKNLSHLRFCHVISVLFLAAWSYVDIVCYPDTYTPFIAIKFFLIIPAFVTGFLFTYSDHYKHLYNIISAAYVVLIGCCFNYMIFINQSNEIYPLVIAITFTFIFNYTFIRLKFTHAAAAGTLVSVITVCNLVLLQPDISHSVRVTCVYYLLLTHFLGLIICYSMERSYRNEYYLGRELEKEKELQVAMNNKLQSSLKEIKVLHEILPICSNCKKIRDDNGHWQQLEEYISSHTKTRFTHSLCEKCTEELYGDEAWYLRNKTQCAQADSE